MPKNKIGGNKSKKQKNSNIVENNNYPLADNPDLLYAVVIKKLGGKNINLKCSDGKERVGRICGSMWKRSFMQNGDFLLISKRDFLTTDNKCDILHKYQPHHANSIIITYNIESLKNDINNNKSQTDFIFQDNDDISDSDISDDDNNNTHITNINRENSNDNSDINIEEI